MYTNLAREAIEKYVHIKHVIEVPAGLPPEFYERQGGVFVTLYVGGELRGCIGTYLPTQENLAAEIISNAVTASSRDTRFAPITPDDLEDLVIEVNVLSDPEKIESARYLDPKKYGIIVKCQDGRCGLLLPDLPGIDSTEAQLSIACQKGAINLVKDKDIELYRFRVEKYTE